MCVGVQSSLWRGEGLGTGRSRELRQVERPCIGDSRELVLKKKKCEHFSGPGWSIRGRVLALDRVAQPLELALFLVSDLSPEVLGDGVGRPATAWGVASRGLKVS